MTVLHRIVAVSRFSLAARIEPSAATGCWALLSAPLEGDVAFNSIEEGNPPRSFPSARATGEASVRSRH
jgi:hypothetical protein